MTYPGNSSANIPVGDSRPLLHTGMKKTGTFSDAQKVMWTGLKTPISQLVKQLTDNISQHREKFLCGAAKEALAKDRKFDSARMSYNRLQSLDGFGYRECYMEKLREVAGEMDPLESNRLYWFGKSGTDHKAVDSKGIVCGQASDQDATSNSKLPRILEVIPSRSTVISTQLQSYVSGLSREDEDPT